MPACSAYGCTNRPGKKIKGISFHRFPKNPTLRAAWVKACRRIQWSPSRVSVLCSEHFSEDQIDRTSYQTAHLKEKAVPNIFESFPSYLQKYNTASKMTGCSAVGCVNRSQRKKPGVTFHRFPKEPVLRASWIVACRRKNWLPSQYSVLCNEHFHEDLIDRTSTGMVRLRPNAIPSIFKFTTSHVKNTKKLKGKRYFFPLSPTTALSDNEKTGSCDENTSLTIKRSDMRTTASNDKKTQSCNESTSITAKDCDKRTSFSDDEDTLSCDESTLVTAKDCDMRITFTDNEESQLINESILSKIKNCNGREQGSNPAKNESSLQHVLLVLPPEKHKSLKKRLAFKGPLAFINDALQSSDEDPCKIPTKHNVMKPAACSKSPSKESSLEDRSLLQFSIGSPDIHCSNSTEESSRPEDFSQAISYVDKVKNRFQRQPNIYKQFLGILHKFKKGPQNSKDGVQSGTKPVTEAEVFAQIAKLFENEDDLIQEFGQFLTNANSSAVPLNSLISGISNSPKKSHHTARKAFPNNNNNKIQSNDRSKSKALAKYVVIKTPRSYSPVYVSSIPPNVPPKIPGICKLKKGGLHSTAPTAFSSIETNQSSGGNVTKAPIVIKTCSNPPAKESSVESMSTVEILEICKSPKRDLHSTVTTAISSTENKQSSNRSVSKAPVVIQTTACSNSAKNESSIENMPLVPIPEICKFPKNILDSTELSNNERNRSSDIRVFKSPIVIQPVFSISPIKGSSVVNIPPVLIPKKRRLFGKHLAPDARTASSNIELTESSDEDSSIECVPTEPVNHSISTRKKCEEEDYPREDVETKYLRRKLEASRNTVAKYQKKIKVLQQQNRRIKRKLAEAKSTISSLKKANNSVFL